MRYSHSLDWQVRGPSGNYLKSKTFFRKPNNIEELKETNRHEITLKTPEMLCKVSIPPYLMSRSKRPFEQIHTSHHKNIYTPS